MSGKIVTPNPTDPKYAAALDLVGRCGAQSLQLRWSDEEQPTVWMAVAEFRVNNQGKVVKHGKTVRHEAEAAINPLDALLRLCDRLVDGAECAHCHRPSGVTEEWRGEMPMADMICWYRYDPELERFRRGCEGEN